jgi:type II secretory pathway predicted ATPase ExeA
MSRNMYTMTLEQVNRELDRLYGRQYAYECLPVDEFLDLRDSYDNLLERIMELEAHQYELAPRSPEVLLRDHMAYVERQAGY